MTDHVLGPAAPSRKAINTTPDPMDFCRECGGTGTLRTPTERGTILREPCWLCGGTCVKAIFL